MATLIAQLETDEKMPVSLMTQYGTSGKDGEAVQGAL